MFRSDLRKKGVCSKSLTKMLCRKKFLVRECIFKFVCHCENCRLSDWLCIREIAETSLNRLLLLLVLKSSYRSYSVEKDVLKTFTGKHFCWSLFLIKLQARLSLKFAKFLRTLIFKNNCIFV